MLDKLHSIRVFRKSCKEWNFATYLLFDFAKHVSLRRLISVIMELLCQKYLNSHASLLCEISVFTGSSVVLFLYAYHPFLPFGGCSFVRVGLGHHNVLCLVP